MQNQIILTKFLKEIVGGQTVAPYQAEDTFLQGSHQAGKSGKPAKIKWSGKVKERHRAFFVSLKCQRTFY